jgi:hypothetical protein
MAARAKTKTTKASPKSSAKKMSSKTSSMKSSMRTTPSVLSSESTYSSESVNAQRKGNKKTLYLLVFLAVLLGLLYYFKDLFVVATVNGKPISRMSVVTQLEKQSGKETVDNLVTKELITQEARKKGITVTKEDVEAEVKKIEDDLSKQGQTLDQVLTMQGLSKADVEDNLMVKLYIERLLSDQVTVSDEDAQKYFDANKATFAKDAKFETEKDQIKETLKQQKLQEQFQTWLDDLKANAKINYFKTY